MKELNASSYTRSVKGSQYHTRARSSYGLAGFQPRGSQRRMVRSFLFASAPSTLGGERTQKSSLDEFSEWCNSVGVWAPKLQIFEEADGYRGLSASERIHEGELVIRVPKEACIASTVPNILYARLHDEIMQFREGHESALSPYVAVLPSTPVGAASFVPEALAALRDTGVDKRIRHYMKAMEITATLQEWEDQHLLRYGQDALSLDVWHLAVSLVHSRTFAVTWKGQGESSKVSLIAPFADMLNHTPNTDEAMRWGWCDEEQAFCVWAKQDVEPAQEVYISYGNKSNDDLLMFYGFVLEDNPQDQVQLFESLAHAQSWFSDNWNRISTERLGFPSDEMEREERIDLYRGTIDNILQYHASLEQLVLGVATGEPSVDPQPLFARRNQDVDEMLMDLFEQLVCLQMSQLDQEHDSTKRFDAKHIVSICIGCRCAELLNESEKSIEAEDANLNGEDDPWGGTALALKLRSTRTNILAMYVNKEI
eukprot:CAMPEP_0114244982 /NCGR_PEP_ID=MMETSP0058-20121206/11639_1 /TAXON_ID=36894 /ORGANISM="Pyramimonas parkeae, CCMP726" /LENGTH=481 /DNA_ID=CAMNT_0001357977 /DNA_START=305 /DNA_END=1750 /DNA_ORIENTATION=-